MYSSVRFRFFGDCLGDLSPGWIDGARSVRSEDWPGRLGGQPAVCALARGARDPTLARSPRPASGCTSS
jgi:hypothetical protein